VHTCTREGYRAVRWWPSCRASWGIFRAGAVIQADENAAHHANLGAGKAKTVSIHQGILHIIQQSGKAVIKFGNGAADLFQDGVTIFYDCTKSHNKNPP